MKRWSKLQKQLYLLLEPLVNIQIHCSIYRMQSQRGNTNIPRYWISLDKEIIWDYPKDFINKSPTHRGKISYFPYITDIPDISKLIREYVDTPKNELLNKPFANDHWGLINILRVADKRIGSKKLQKLQKRIKNDEPAMKIIKYRLNQKFLNRKSSEVELKT